MPSPIFKDLKLLLPSLIYDRNTQSDQVSRNGTFYSLTSLLIVLYCQKMYKNLICSIFFLFVLACSAQAQFTELSDSSSFVEKAAAITEETTTLKCNFVQEKHLSFMSAPITSSGVFHYKEGNRIRWQYTEPYDYLIILNDGQLLIDDEGNQNEIDLSNNKMFDQINNVITSAMSGNVFGPNDQFSQSLAESKTEYRVTMLPLIDEIKTYLTEIEIYLSKENMLVSKLILKESSDDFTKISFQDNKINSNITDDTFLLNQ